MLVLVQKISPPLKKYKKVYIFVIEQIRNILFIWKKDKKDKKDKQFLHWKQTILSLFILFAL
jgi:hypothetical protein